MNDDSLERQEPVAGWFRPAALLSVLFMLVGAATYLVYVYTDPATMPLDQRALYEAEPWWMTGGYAIAVWAGLAGTVLLFLRKGTAVPLLLLSLLGTIVWFAAFFLVPELRANVSSSELTVPVVVLVLTWTIFWFARHSRKRGWLA